MPYMSNLNRPRIGAMTTPERPSAPPVSVEALLAISSSPEKKLLLQELIEKKHPVAIDLFGKPLAPDQWFSIAIRRRVNPEIIALYLNGDQMKRHGTMA